MRTPFEDIPFEQEQRDLLAEMVEADRTVQARDREFYTIGTTEGYLFHHPGVKRHIVSQVDLHELADYGLLRMNITRQGEKYEVTGIGRQYYAWMKREHGGPVEQLEAEVRSLLDVGSFRGRHVRAYDRWAEATTRLWDAETAAEFTYIGHACREAIQLFITDLVDARQPANPNPDPRKTDGRWSKVHGKGDGHGVRSVRT